MVLLEDVIFKPITGEWGKKIENEDEGVKVLRTTNFTNLGVIDLSDVVRRNITQKKIEQKKLLKGDIIIEKSGGGPTQPVGRVVFFNEEGTYLCNNFTSILRPKKNKIFPKYLHYLLFANYNFGITNYFQNKTTGIINLQLPRYVNKLEIPLPPLKTQQHIASILDDAAALRDKTKQLLEEYDNLAQSIFLDMFGDPITNSKNLTEVLFNKVMILKRGYDLPVRKRVEGPIPILASNGILGYHNEFKVEGPGVVTGRSGTLGKVHYVESNYWPLNTALYVQDFKNNNPIYLLYLLKNYRVERFARGAGVPTLNRNLVHAEKIIKVSKSMQNQFAEKIALIEQQKDLAKQELKESEDLFNCLLQKAFKGELISESEVV
ncbi:MAG TPA: restriction endonuclease subunit S [Flavobacteriaceae bacterium]|nr:restriction endonuclease subunit S [Flavobacteriaceae bacterium]